MGSLSTHNKADWTKKIDWLDRLLTWTLPYSCVSISKVGFSIIFFYLQLFISKIKASTNFTAQGHSSDLPSTLDGPLVLVFDTGLSVTPLMDHLGCLASHWSVPVFHYINKRRELSYKYFFRFFTCKINLKAPFQPQSCMGIMHSRGQERLYMYDNVLHIIINSYMHFFRDLMIKFIMMIKITGLVNSINCCW